MRLTFAKGITLLAKISEQGLSFDSIKKIPFAVHPKGLRDDYVPCCAVKGRNLLFSCHDFPYRLSIKKGFFQKEDKKGLLAGLVSEQGMLILHC